MILCFDSLIMKSVYTISELLLGLSTTFCLKYNVLPFDKFSHMEALAGAQDNYTKLIQILEMEGGIDTNLMAFTMTL